MPVRYLDFHSVDIAEWDAIVAGAGLAGSVMAQQLAQRLGMRVLVLEKRDTVGGCLVDEVDRNGIRVNRYGAHILHTNRERVVDYVSRFAEWRTYRHEVMADWYKTYLPLPFNINSIECAFGRERGRAMVEKLEGRFGPGAHITLGALERDDLPESRELARFVRENVFERFSQKQWGLSPDEVESGILDRMPVRLTRSNVFYTDAYQGVPKKGYTAFVESLLSDERIGVCLRTEAESAFGMEFAGPEEFAPLSQISLKGRPFTGPIVFTGPIDELFLQRFGRLPYRTIDFARITVACEYALPCGTVNHTVTEDCTRETECKRISGDESPVTTLLREYPRPYDDPRTQVPLFPVFTDENRARHRIYLGLVEPLSNFHVLGRLAEYAYYDMDDMIARALACADDLERLYRPECAQPRSAEDPAQPGIPEGEPWRSTDRREASNEDHLLRRAVL